MSHASTLLIRSVRRVAPIIVAWLSVMLLPAAGIALPPRPPNPAKTRSAIKKLKVAAPLSMRGYSRTRFGGWLSQGGGCTTREVVLRRDGRSVRIGSDCKIISGTWTSYYDGLSFTDSSQLDIDHIVPLANAWRSGASRWSGQRRAALANDLHDSQLIAVSAHANRSKGDSGPEEWRPPRHAAWCLYSRWWVQTKRHWRLTITVLERRSLRRMLATC